MRAEISSINGDRGMQARDHAVPSLQHGGKPLRHRGRHHHLRISEIDGDIFHRKPIDLLIGELHAAVGSDGDAAGQRGEEREDQHAHAAGYENRKAAVWLLAVWFQIRISIALTARRRCRRYGPWGCHEYVSRGCPAITIGSTQRHCNINRQRREDSLPQPYGDLPQYHNNIPRDGSNRKNGKNGNAGRGSDTAAVAPTYKLPVLPITLIN